MRYVPALPPASTFDFLFFASFSFLVHSARKSYVLFGELPLLLCVTPSPVRVLRVHPYENDTCRWSGLCVFFATLLTYLITAPARGFDVVDSFPHLEPYCKCPSSSSFSSHPPHLEHTTRVRLGKDRNSSHQYFANRLCDAWHACRPARAQRRDPTMTERGSGHLPAAAALSLHEAPSCSGSVLRNEW